MQALPDSMFVLVAGTAVLVRGGAAQQSPKLLWHDVAALRSAGVELAEDHFVIAYGEVPTRVTYGAILRGCCRMGMPFTAPHYPVWDACKPRTRERARLYESTSHA